MKKILLASFLLATGGVQVAHGMDNLKDILNCRESSDEDKRLHKKQILKEILIEVIAESNSKKTDG